MTGAFKWNSHSFMVGCIRGLGGGGDRLSKKEVIIMIHSLLHRLKHLFSNTKCTCKCVRCTAGHHCGDYGRGCWYGW